MKTRNEEGLKDGVAFPFNKGPSQHERVCDGLVMRNVADNCLSAGGNEDIRNERDLDLMTLWAERTETFN